MEIKAGFLQGVRCVPTGVFGKRPQPLEISLIVIHSISLPPALFNTPYVDCLFTGNLNPDEHPYFRNIAGLELSSHLFINREGVITQYVSFLDRAYHAGRSSYLGRAECNDYSIGIELEGTDHCPFTIKQYDALEKCISAVNKAYPDTLGHIAGHNEVAPGRKTDPGLFFDWSRFRSSDAL